MSAYENKRITRITYKMKKLKIDKFFLEVKYLMKFIDIFQYKISH